MTTEETTGQQLLRIADEIRVRIHLAGMEAKEAWSKLEPRVKDFEQKLERAAGRAADEVDKVAVGLHAELKKLNDKLFAQT